MIAIRLQLKEHDKMNGTLSPLKQKRMRELVKEGLSSGVICSRLGISRKLLLDYAKRNGFKAETGDWGVAGRYKKKLLKKKGG